MMRAVTFVMISLFVADGAVAQIRNQAPTTIKKRVITVSGDAEMLFSGKPSDTRAKIAGLCQKLGWAPRLAGSDNRLDCDVPSTEKTTVALDNYHSTYDMLSGNGYTDLPVGKRVTFWLTPDRGGTRARARGERIYPSVNHDQPIHKAMGDENTFNGLINIMALIGGRFAPGTSFQRLGYIGFGSDSVAKRQLADGRARAAIAVGAVDMPSPAAEAGIKLGDLVTAINGRDFSDYEDAAKTMAKLRPGDAVRLAVERDGKLMNVDLIASQAPKIR